jgi:hypothetical protein
MLLSSLSGRLALRLHLALYMEALAVEHLLFVKLITILCLLQVAERENQTLALDVTEF